MARELTPPVRHRITLSGVARLAAVVLVLAGLGVQSSSAAEDRRFPGLPAFAGDGDHVGPRATGINQVSTAKQWVRLPPIQVGAWNRIAKKRTDVSCQAYFPYREILDYHATAFFKSPKGAPKPWGYLGPFVTRTVAFGSIPVEASVELRQPRDAEDMPVGLEIKQKTGDYCVGQSPFPDIVVPGSGTSNAHWDPATVDGPVQVGITALKIDGVDIRLAGGCRAETPGAIALRGREHFTMNPENLIPGVVPSGPNLMVTPYFGVANGGLLRGSVDIPAFSGCTTESGEDVSRLLTAAVSGADNPVTMRAEGLSSDLCLGPTEPCAPFPGLPFPTNE